MNNRMTWEQFLTWSSFLMSSLFILAIALTSIR